MMKRSIFCRIAKSNILQMKFTFNDKGKQSTYFQMHLKVINIRNQNVKSKIATDKYEKCKSIALIRFFFKLKMLNSKSWSNYITNVLFSPLSNYKEVTKIIHVIYFREICKIIPH